MTKIKTALAKASKTDKAIAVVIFAVVPFVGTACALAYLAVRSR